MQFALHCIALHFSGCLCVFLCFRLLLSFFSMFVYYGPTPPHLLMHTDDIDIATTTKMNNNDTNTNRQKER